MKTKQPRKLLGVDCETTGLDLRHGAKPYLVTTCDEEGNQEYWEWDVNPLTRQPTVPKTDLQEIRKTLSGKTLIFQNPKFDVRALSIIMPWVKLWNWKYTYDTLLAGHLLSSNSPHDLTSMVLIYLGINLKGYEDTIKDATNKARRIARKHFPDWRIASKDLPEMPSAKGSVWKADMWLPKALIKKAIWSGCYDLIPDDPQQPTVGRIADCEVKINRQSKWGNPFKLRKDYSRQGILQKYAHYIWNNEELLAALPELYKKKLGCHCSPKPCHGDILRLLCHPWMTACSEYANSDSASTLPLFIKMRKLLKEQGLWKLYEERLKLLPVIYKMETRGVTLSATRLEKQVETYSKESEKAGKTCVSIAAKHGSELSLPKSGSNKSLHTVVFEHMKLPVIKKSEKTGVPSLDAEVIKEYLNTLTGSKLKFIENLSAKRKRDTALSYMESYKRFWISGDEYGEWKNFRVLFPSINPTGTGTLRFSSSNPNEQNISKKEGFNLRYSFGPVPGREWWALDYDNIELRIPGYESGEPVMLKLFENPNEPPFFGSYHLLVFSLLHPKKYDHDDEFGLLLAKDKHKEDYGKVKNGNFAVQYGAVESSGTADRAFGVKGAQAKVQKRFTKMAGLNRKWIDYAKKYGYVETMPDKSVDPSRGYPLWCTRSKWGKIIETIPLSYHVQGTACWVMSRAMVKVQNYLDIINGESSLGYYMIMNVHDEMVLDFPQKKNRGNLPKVKKIRQLMESIGPDIGVKLTCGIDYHPSNWSEGESV